LTVLPPPAARVFSTCRFRAASDLAGDGSKESAKVLNLIKGDDRAY
jgi:hypothetical protein